MSEEKYCVHVAGPDDLIPVRSIGEAVRVSAFLNSEYAEIRQSLSENDRVTPYCFSAPMVWPYEEKAHAEQMERLNNFAKKGEPFWSVC